MLKSPVAILRTAVIVWCGLAGGTGCGGGGEPAAEAAAGAAAGAKPVPPTWSVAFGETGGFTGGGRGYVITAAGEVREWSRITPDDTTSSVVLGTASPSILAELEAAMREPELQSATLRETGNLTRSLEWRDAPRVVRWTWADRGPKAALPQPLQRAVAAAEAAVASARNAREAR